MEKPNLGQSQRHNHRNSSSKSSAITKSLSTDEKLANTNIISISNSRERSTSLKREDDRRVITTTTSLNLFDPAYSSPSLIKDFSDMSSSSPSSHKSNYYYHGNNNNIRSLFKRNPLLIPLESGQRSLDRKLLVGKRSRHLQRSIKTRKSQSSDYLDKLDNSISSNSVTTANNKRSLRKSKVNSAAKMSKIEKGLYLGSLEAATDVILLESHHITHIITIDSVPLPRKMSSFLPRIVNIHFQITDTPDEDLLSCIEPANEFIGAAQSSDGNVLVHCLRGKSRSPSLVIAYLMQKYKHPMEKIFKKVKAKREVVSPQEGFLAQLKMFESMDYVLDPSNVQFRMFKQNLASERMRKAKILFRDHLNKVLDEDPGEKNNSAKGHYSVLFKCKRCRRTLATSHNMMPHVKGTKPHWTDPTWSLPAEEVLEGATDLGLNLCSQSVFVNPMTWMQNEIKQNLSGRLFCPNCQTKVGDYSWVRGSECLSCKVMIKPAFQLDVTEIIFKTKNRFLQSSGREPVLV